MLDKRTARLMESLIKICSDGSYKIVEAADLVKAMLPKFTVTAESVAQIVKFLAVNELIDVKYSDGEKYCIAVLPKGRVFDESNKKVGRIVGRKPDQIVLGKALAVVIIVGCFLAAFAGAFVANLIK